MQFHPLAAETKSYSTRYIASLPDGVTERLFDLFALTILSGIEILQLRHGHTLLLTVTSSVTQKPTPFLGPVDEIAGAEIFRIPARSDA